MPNKIRGDAEIVANGKRYTMRLTLGALAEIETGLGLSSLNDFGKRLQKYATADIAVVASALLRGGGHDVSADDVMSLDVELGTWLRAIAEAFTNAGLASSTDSAPSRETNSARGDAEAKEEFAGPLAGAASPASASV
jgi:hypothetical protein